VIVGAGFGGLAAAKRLADAPVEVTVIDRRNHHLFQPLLYQVATAALSPADIAAPIRAVLRRQANTEVLLDEVIGVDLGPRRVLTRDGGDRPFDYLVVATGSEFSYFGHEKEGWPQLAPGLKTLDDATSIRRRILLAFERAETTDGEAERRRLLTFVLVGGGPTGVEMAGAVAEIARSALVRDFRHFDPSEARILLIEAGPRLLAGFSERLSRYALAALRRMGVEVWLTTPVQQIEPDGVLAKGEFVPAANVIWCAGVKASPVGAWLGVETARNGAVKVAPDLSVPGHPEIFVIGDAASEPTPDGRGLPGLAPAAKQEGEYVADVIARRVEGRVAPGPFEYRDRGALATIGRGSAVADFGRLRLTGLAAWLLWGVAHIYFLIGFRNRLAVFLNWIFQYLTFGRGARLITGEVTSETPSRTEAGAKERATAATWSTSRPRGAEPPAAATARAPRSGDLISGTAEFAGNKPSDGAHVPNIGECRADASHR
jgi:NADH dehydrogenase